MGTIDQPPTTEWRDSQVAHFQNAEPQDGKNAIGLHVRWYDDQNKVNSR